MGGRIKLVEKMKKSDRKKRKMSGPGSNTPKALVKPKEISVKPAQVIEKIICPYCRSKRIQSNGTHGRIRYYRCLRCVDPETGTWTTFKVIIKARRADK